MLSEVVSKPIFTYELALNKVVQAVKNGSNIEKAWKEVILFLTLCTTSDIQKPNNIRLQIHTHNSRDTQTLEKDITTLFGKSKTHFDSIFNILTWNLKANDLDSCIGYLISKQPLPKDYNYRPFIELRIDYIFKFKDPQTGIELSSQNNDSMLSVFISKNTKVMPEFCFPFSKQEDLKCYMETIEPHLPFKKLDRQAFRYVYPNKKGTSNVIKRIQL